MRHEGRRSRAELRRRLYEVLEHGPVGDSAGRLAGRLIVLLIVLNLVAMTLESVPDLQVRYGVLFSAIEAVSLVVFTIEYGLRIWVAGEHGSILRSRPASGRDDHLLIEAAEE
jgi:voltage-gated potassium channel